jgi:hypothetical protein
MTKDDLLEQIKGDNEDIKLKLDAILNALIIPRLGETKREIRKTIENRVRGELGRKIWNLIDGQRTIADIGKRLKRTPQVILRYIKRWELDSPPLVYVAKMKEESKVYKRLFEIKLAKPKKEKEPEQGEKLKEE